MDKLKQNLQKAKPASKDCNTFKDRETGWIIVDTCGLQSGSVYDFTVDCEKSEEIDVEDNISAGIPWHVPKQGKAYRQSKQGIEEA